WGILALAQFSVTLGDILWAIIELGLKSSPFPSIADGPYLLFYPLFLAGIFILPSTRLSPTEWLKRILDLSIVMIAAILGFWIFIIGPILGTEITTPFLETLLTAVYPVGDLILLFALLVIIYYRSEKFIVGSIWILALGSIVMIVTDSIFSYQSLLGTYISGGALDLGYIISYLLFAFAGIYQAVAAQTYKEENTFPFKNLIIRERISKVLAYMPYLWVVGAYYLLRKYYNSEFLINSDALFIGIGCIIGFVIIRQIITLTENNHLFSDLRKALEEGNRQAAELNKTNKNLQQEIIKRKRVEEQLLHDTLHDGLTGLANRVLFLDRLVHAIEFTKRELEFHYSVLFLDIDNFKSINDNLGHLSGDQILIEIAKKLKNCARSIDTVARFGGDEFVFLLEHTMGNNSAISVADRILTEFQNPIIYKGKEVLIKCSIGIVQGISEYNDSEDILRDVDIALYRAKELGKARYEIFTIDMRASAMSRVEIEGDLRRAISNGEFFLDYQPIYSLEQNLIVGMEALVRWRHPLRGLVLSSEFIQIAEDSALIIQIGDWVLLEACTQLKKWHIEYPELDYLIVNVNISGKQISQKDFADKVKEILCATGLNPERLKLEITENAFIESQSLINELLSDIRKTGVTFVIDDFGTGYLSLAYLQKFSVNTIKIDKSFVDEIVEGNKGYEIIKSIILMAQGLGIDTVAEGIENSEQLQKLKSLKCKYGQGFYLSKPVDAKLIETILKNQFGLQVP
ncbi:MAG: EAL domain-containing protein, partial [Bacteroidetes bacterium]|nr:EAL domain-containing protein [Bacteroidota bacterium]